MSLGKESCVVKYCCKGKSLGAGFFCLVFVVQHQACVANIGSPLSAPISSPRKDADINADKL
jgi:hypothetical protein